MILSGLEIAARMAAGDIVIDPYDPESLGPNSYDVHLGQALRVFADVDGDGWIDPKKPFTWISHIIGDGGYILRPGTLYLASTVEYTETRRLVPNLDGTSSVGRLGIFIHATAGRGDVGFCGHWTLEISCVRPVKVYAGMPIGQLTYQTVVGDVIDYKNRKSSNYALDGRDPLPQGSRMWKKLMKS